MSGECAFSHLVDAIEAIERGRQVYLQMLGPGRDRPLNLARGLLKEDMQPCSRM